MNKYITPKLAIVAVGVAAVLFLAVNVIANTWLRGLRADFTEEKSFTTSDQIKPIFANIKEPIIVRLYYSQAIGDVSQRHAIYYQRVRDLLRQYADLSNGAIKVELYNPEPFSDVEDRAVGFGLQGLALNQSGETGYFGLAATNSTDDRQVIPFFDLEREQFLEYDLTKLIYGLSQPSRPKVGLITSLPVSGGTMNPMQQMQMGGGGQTPPWALMQQIREFFTVQTLNADLTEIPKDITVLLMIQPENLSEPAQRAIDQFVLQGGKALVFVDPKVESLGMMGGMGAPAQGNLAGINKLLAAWGVAVPSDKVVGDIENAMRINTSDSGRPVISDYVAWMQLRRGFLDPADSVTGDLNQINFGTPGGIDAVQGAGTTVTALMTTGVNTMRIDTDKFTGMPDIVALFRDFKSANKREILAARVTGTAKTAFPDAPVKESRQPIQVIVVSDTDMLTDRFWVDGNNFMGQRVLVQTADNGNFVVNALENLSGSPALSSLRGRGVQSRPFTLVNDIRRDAEMQYRATEQSLTSRLAELQKRVDEMQVRRDDKGGAVLSEQDMKTLESYRGEILSTRRELREVQRALRQSIDSLERVVTFFNIGAVPVVFGLILIGTAFARHRRRKRRLSDV